MKARITQKDVEPIFFKTEFFPLVPPPFLASVVILFPLLPRTEHVMFLPEIHLQ
jgi:hypothetical protein